jgi:hypothetical protein
MNRRTARAVLAGVAAVVAVAVVVLGLRSCSTGPATTSPTASPSASPSATPSAARSAQRTGPLSGRALAVKIDNTARSHPHIGMAQADVVYVEPVEGGLTRLLAVFSSSMPKEVGPVRSARESDLAILGSYGPVAFAYSGASHYTERLLAKGREVNLSYGASTRGFRRDPLRPAPYNVFGDPKALLARAGGSVVPKDPGFVFGAAPAGGAKATEVATRWPAARVSFTWDPRRKEYLLSTDGRPDVDPRGRQHGAATVVVQEVRINSSTNKDVLGAPTPVVTLTGKGPVRVLRGGKAWRGTWSRTALTAPTSFRGSSGGPLTMDPSGTVWVLLVAPGQAVTVR